MRRQRIKKATFLEKPLSLKSQVWYDITLLHSGTVNPNRAMAS